MCWLERFSLVMRSSITLLRETVEDPERMLHQLIIDMEEELESARHSVAEAIADEIQLSKRADAAAVEADQWLQRATAALQRQDESSAQAALEHKVLAAQRAEQLREEAVQQKTQTDKLRSALTTLEDKIRQARQRRTLLLARITRADSTRRINAALGQADSRSALAEFGRLESRVERAEAIAEAYDRLEGRDPDAEELAQEFAAADRKEQLQKEFEDLKRRVAGSH